MGIFSSRAAKVDGLQDIVQFSPHQSTTPAASSCQFKIFSIKY
jgi:hypothetical protein